MRCCHSPRAPRDLIQRRPKRFNRLAIYLSAAFNEAGRIPSEAGVLVPMNVKKANAQSELQAVRNLEILAAGHPVFHVNAPLTHDVIANEGCLYAVHVKVQGFEYRIIHVFLTFGASIFLGMPIDMGTHASPL